MLIAQLSEVSKAFGAHEVLDTMHLQIRDGARLALVGRNGAGKTTLFRLLSGEMEPDTGTVWRRKGAVIASMEQEVQITDQRTLRDEAARGLKHLEELHEELEEVTTRMGEIKEGDSDADELVERYGHLQERLEREGGYSFEAKVKSVLSGLHFSEADLDRPLAEFSGGQKSRAILARVLLRDPDLLLLDEPTNHLDLAAIEWLGTFLSSYQGAFVVVSHDRMFVNKLATGVAEIRFRRLHQFNGNYDAFLAERERRLEEQSKKYELQQAEIRRQEDFVRKNIVGQKTKQAQSRRKMLEKMVRVEAPEWPASSIRMRLPEPERTAKIVVEGKKLTKSFGNISVFSDVSFQVFRGQKIGLIGPNGVGKTTLARLLVGEESPSSGTMRIGPGVQIGYSEQEQKALQGAKSVLDEVWEVTPQVSEGEIRNFLGGFLFRGEEVFKSLNSLSGGEKSRVALAKLVREGANFLILDEPTNHLDIESREVIEAGLRAFTGTVLVVSHDRYFLDRVVDHVLELVPHGCHMWEGGYSEYVRKQASLAAIAEKGKKKGENATAPSVPVKKADPSPVNEFEEAKKRKRGLEKLRKRVGKAETRIQELETKKESLLMEMADPAVATNALKLGGLVGQVKKLEADISDTIQEWERLTLRLDAYLDGPK